MRPPGRQQTKITLLPLRTQLIEHLLTKCFMRKHTQTHLIMKNLYSTIIRHLVHDNQTFPSFLYEQSIVTVNDHILRSLQ